MPTFILRVPVSVLIAWILLIFAVIGSSLWFQGGGFLEDSEAYYFLKFHLADRGVLERVFDVAQNDWGFYQGRELSYLVDDADAWFIAASIRVGAPHFYPLSHYLSLALIALIHLFCCRRYLPGLPAFHSIALVLLFLTTPFAYFSTFYRSSKILVALLLTMLIWYAFYQAVPLRAPDAAAPEGHAFRRLLSRLRWRDLSVVFALSLAMTLVDRQGFFFSVALSGIMVIAYGLFRKGSHLAHALVFLASCFVNAVYNLYIGPWLILLTNGYRPSFGYQNPSFVFDRLSASTPDLQAEMGSPLLLPEMVSFFFGNVGIAGGFAVLVFFALVLSLRRAGSGAAENADLRFTRYAFTIVFLLGAGAITVLNWVMVLRASHLLLVENRLVYYNLPTASLTLFTATVCVDRLLLAMPRLRSVSAVVLVAALLGNIAALPGHRSSYLHDGSQWSGYEQGPQLLECLRGRVKGERTGRLTAEGEEICRFLRRKAGVAGFSDPGPAAAAFDIGTRYLMGDGVAKNFSVGIEWYRKAADLGYVTAQIELAWRYWWGRGLERDRAEAVKWLRMAAENGDPESQLRLVVLHRLGDGVPRSEEEALQWLRRAAESGHARAQRGLARRYMNGDGVPKDLVQAHIWMSLGSGRKPASQLDVIQRLERIMDDEAVAEARRRARDWSRTRGADTSH